MKILYDVDVAWGMLSKWIEEIGCDAENTCSSLR